MYDIRQFRPTLFLLLGIGFIAFALATSSIEMFLLPIAGLLLNGYLVRIGKFRAMPRWLAAVITTGLFLYTANTLWENQNQSRAVFILGQFLVFLQLVKLYEVRGNRDYAQLLVLSLLLVVAAAINSASLIFGLALILHIFISLYACLLFHLKLETDQAKALLGLSEENVPPETLRQDQRYLGRSMRRLTILVAFASIATAVAVFLLWPRDRGANVFSPLQNRSSASMSGFGDEVSFENIARITQNTERVAYVRLLHNGAPVQGTMSLLLRGRTYDSYSGNSPASGPPYQWTNVASAGTNRPLITLRADDEKRLVASPGLDEWRQQITLERTGSRSLFAMAGPTSLKMAQDRGIFYRRDDETLEMQDPINGSLRYEVVSRNNLAPVDLAAEAQAATAGQSFRERARRLLNSIQDEERASRFPIAPEISAFARKPEVSGADAEGPLIARRGRGAVTELDLAIARNIELYLRSNYEYTLDLSDLSRDRDPLVVFLTDFKRGHCEFFAGAMTLALQSLGIQARLVTGFRSDEYNNWGDGYYIVRQSHAHAWVEVLGPDGWETFDPTSSRLADSTATAKSTWQQMMHAFNYLEYLWAESVVAYDRESRANLISSADTALMDTAGQTASAVRAIKRQFGTANTFYRVSARVMTGLVCVMIAFILSACAWFVFERWRLKQRARRIGLDQLPKTQQLKLARQLEFFDRLTMLLELHGFRRPAHLTPIEFSRSISFLPPDVYDTVQRLTQLFYHVRYGQHELSSAQQRRLVKSVDALPLAASAIRL